MTLQPARHTTERISHGTVGTDDPGAPRRRRILVLAPFPPALDGAHGGSRAIARLVVALSARNQVALAYLRAPDEDTVDGELAGRCAMVLDGERGGSSASSVRPLTLAGSLALSARLLAGLPLWAAGRWSASFAARIDDLVATWRPDVVQAEFSAMGQYLAGAARGTSRLVVTFHEPAAAAADDRAAAGGLASLAWRVEARRWRRFEADLLASIDAGVTFTRRDADVLRRLQESAGQRRMPASRPAPGGGRADTPISVIPLGVTLPGPVPPSRSRPPRLLFVGNFVHPPNLEAARELVEEIFPPLRRRFGELELLLVGPGAPARLTARAPEGVRFTGYVPDVGALLATATIVVAPLRTGGGMRVKVLEAMAAGRAIVATPLAVEGLRATSGRELLVADDTESFRRAVARLLAEPARRDALGRAARDLVVREHSWERMAASYEEVYDRLLAGSRPGIVASHG